MPAFVSAYDVQSIATTFSVVIMHYLLTSSPIDYIFSWCLIFKPEHSKFSDILLFCKMLDTVTLAIGVCIRKITTGLHSFSHAKMKVVFLSFHCIN